MFWRCFTGQHVSPATALTRLHAHFSTRAAAISSSSSSSTQQSPFTVLLLDEIDFLNTADCKVLYQFLDWPLMANAKLAVIGISNVMDLPERLSLRFVYVTCILM